ncbi:MAG: hypothetical protein M0R03_01495 [Novosphingobium sp.]|nr:hypothetical protein [Novosphingobium sp.]
MSARLAIAAAFSILAMALFTLFGEHSTRISLGPEAVRIDVSTEIPALPSPFRWIPAIR